MTPVFVKAAEVVVIAAAASVVTMIVAGTAKTVRDEDGEGCFKAAKKVANDVVDLALQVSERVSSLPQVAITRLSPLFVRQVS